MYTAIFATTGDTAALERTDRRYLWLRKRLAARKEVRCRDRLVTGRRDRGQGCHHAVAQSLQLFWSLLTNESLPFCTLTSQRSTGTFQERLLQVPLVGSAGPFTTRVRGVRLSKPQQFHPRNRSSRRLAGPPPRCGRAAGGCAGVGSLPGVVAAAAAGVPLLLRHHQGAPRRDPGRQGAPGPRHTAPRAPSL